MRRGRWIAVATGVASGAALVAAGVWVARALRQGDMLYEPLDTPKPLADGVWIVDGAFGPGIPVRMTVMRLAEGGLVLHSPTQYSPALRAALEQIGPIRHLVAPNSVHWTFLREWQDAIPDAVLHAAPGLRDRAQVKRAGLRIDRDLSSEPPFAWRGEIDQQVLTGGAGFREVAMLHRASRTLLMTDLMQNFEPSKLPAPLRPVAALLGNTVHGSRAPAHLRAAVRLRPNREGARRVIGWAPDRVVVAHGAVIEADAAERVSRSLAWMT